MQHSADDNSAESVSGAQSVTSFHFILGVKIFRDTGCELTNIRCCGLHAFNNLHSLITYSWLIHKATAAAAPRHKQVQIQTHYLSNSNTPANKMASVDG